MVSGSSAMDTTTLMRSSLGTAARPPPGGPGDGRVDRSLREVLGVRRAVERGRAAEERLALLLGVATTGSNTGDHLGSRVAVAQELAGLRGRCRRAAVGGDLDADLA